MLTRTSFIIILFYCGLACCTSKRSGPSHSGESDTNDTAYTNITQAQADTLVSRWARAGEYDTLQGFLQGWIGNRVAAQRSPEAVHVAARAFALLPDRSPQQKNAALLLYAQRSTIEKDTAASRLFYSLFAGQYAYAFRIDVYDPQYTEIAEYFIALQNSQPWLDKTTLLDFKESLGIGYNVAGDLKKAISYDLELVNYDLSTGDLYNISGSAPNLCIPLMENGLYDSVIRFTGRLMRTFSFSRENLSVLHTTRAEAFLRTGDLGGAVAESQLTATMLPFVPAEDLPKRKLELGMTRSGIEYAFSRYRECLRQCNLSLQSALAYKGVYRDRIAGKILLQKGAAYRKLQLPDSAVIAFHQALYTVTRVDSADRNALPAEKDIYAENTIMDALDSLAAVWDQQYTTSQDTRFIKQALQARKLAFIAEKKLLEAFSYDDAMQTMLRQGKDRSEKALDNCYRLWQQEKKEAWVQEAILLNEHSKSIILLHSVKRNNVLKAVPVIDSAAQPLNHTRYRIVILERSLALATDPGIQDSIRRELEMQNRVFLEQESRLNQQYPALRRTGMDTARLHTSELRRSVIQRNTVLLQYFTAGNGAYVTWLDDKKGSGMEFIAANALPVVTHFLQHCKDPHGLFEKDRAAFFRLTDSCTRTILPPAVATAIRNGDCDHLLVIPDGVFSVLPFEALTVNNNEFLIRNITVSQASSISTLLVNNTDRSGDERLAVFTPFSRQGFHRLPRLPFTKEEADAVTKSHPGSRLFDDAAATIGHFRNSLQQDAVIHIATHADLGDGHEPRIYFSDSILYMQELYALGTTADLVMLSGCETGLGTLDPNEGPLSLSRAFYYAGAGNVINSLWPIDDAATAQLFNVFYKTYTQGNSGDALRKAKLQYLQKNTGSLNAPYYWAGLVHTGQDKEGDGKDSRWLLGVLLISLLLSVIVLLYRYKRRRPQLSLLAG